MSEIHFPRTMKAAILAELKKPLVVDEVGLPAALEAGQVLVKVAFSGICGSQLGEMDGNKGDDKYLPHLLGHEATGIVKAVGAGVRFVAPDDRVIMHWRKGRGIESVPPSYTWRGKKLNAGLIATFNEYAIVSENRLTRIDSAGDMETGALYGCAVTTGFGVVENNANVRIGDSVVVFGAGGVGLNIIQAASMRSAHPIIAVDVHEKRLDLARTLGATHTINSKAVDARVAIEGIVGKQSVDVFIDNTGQPAIIEMGYELTKPDGKVILVGVPRKGNNITIYSLPLHFGKSISGSHGGEARPEEDIPRYQKIFAVGLGKLKPLITEYFTLDQINTAIERMRSGELTGRCLIRMAS